MANHRSTRPTRRRTGLLALAAVVTVLSGLVAITSGLFAPTTATAGSVLQRYLPVTSTVTRTITATTTATTTATATATVRPSAGVPAADPGATSAAPAPHTTTGPRSTTSATPGPTSPSAATSSPRFPGDPGLGNMYVGESVGGGDPSAHEQRWGTTVGAYRSYFVWNQNAKIAARAARDLAAGRLPFISFHTATTWAQIADGSQDAVLKDLMSRLAALHGPVWLAMDHEPYDNQAQKGTPTDFGNANKHLMGMLPSNVALVPILQTAPFDPTVGGSQNIAAWYPPGSYTFIGLDTYNHRYYTPDPGHKYRDPATVLSVVDLVRQELGRPDVPIAIAEFGTRTNPAVPGQAAQWLRDFVSQAKTMNIPAVCYFDSGLNVNDGGTPWSLDDRTDGTSGTERINAYGPLVAAGAHLP